MTTYTLTVSTNALGLGVLSGVRVTAERKRTVVTDFIGGQALSKNSVATNSLGVATVLLQPDDNTVYHEIKIFDLAGIPVYSRIITMPPQNISINDVPSQDIVSASAAAAAISANTAEIAAAESEAQATIAVETVGASSNSQILGWAYVQSFSVISATRNANNVITTASIVWPNGATGTFTTDTINTTFNAIDAWHATHILGVVTKTVTQTAVTRNASGAVTAQPAITLA